MTTALDRRWRPDEDAVLIATHRTLTIKQQSAQINRSYRSIAERRHMLIQAGRIESTQRKANRLWTEIEDAFVRESLADGLSLKGIASHLGRTQESVRMYCQRVLGVTIDELRYPFVRNVEEVASLFGVFHAQVRRWITWGWLKARRAGKKRGKWTFITEAALWDFIRDKRSWFAWRVEQMTDTDWREQAQWYRNRAGGEWLTTKQAAIRMGYNHNCTVLRMIDAGEIAATRHGVGKWYVWSGDIKQVAQ